MDATEVAAEAMDRLTSGDVEGHLALLADDVVEERFIQAVGIPAVVRGKAAWAKALVPVAGLLRQVGFGPFEVAAATPADADGMVWVRGTISGREETGHPGAPRQVVEQVAHVELAVRDGLVVWMRSASPPGRGAREVRWTPAS
jgi:hypothetical protein